MKIAGEATLVAPVGQVWDALLDPRVLVRTIPGCERLEETGENRYQMTVTAGVAAIRGTYSGSCELSNLEQHESLTLAVQGAGAPGTIGAEVQVRLDENDGPGGRTTTLTYEADAVVGGMIGGVGQRMLTSVSRRMANEFFTNVERAISGAAAHEQPVPGESVGAGAAAGVSTGSTTGAGVFTAPTARTAGAGDQESFLKGVAVGAGLVLAGVIVGGLFGRRRG